MMRGLAASSTRPCLRSLQSTFRPASARKVLSLSHADAFLMFMPGTLAAAFVIDATVKARQVQEWDKQIAAIERETELLRERQLQSWQRIQSRSIARGSAVLQKRLYSTCSRLYADRDDNQGGERLDPAQLADVDSDPDLAERLSFPLTESIQDEAEHYLKSDPSDDSSTSETPAQYIIDAQVKYERLHATQLALELLLEVRKERTTDYSRGLRRVEYHASLDFIAFQLNKVKEMSRKSPVRDAPFISVLPPSVDHQKQILASKIDVLINSYKNFEIPYDSVVIQFAQLVSSHPVGLPVRSYVALMQAFNLWNSEQPFAQIIEESLWRSRQYLDTVAVYNIIYQLGRQRNTARLNDFLDRLSLPDVQPKTSSRWIRANVQGMPIIIPQSRQPWLLTATIVAALQTRQYQVAEATAVVWFSRYHADPHQDPRCKYYITTNFLQSYAFKFDWETGKKWLQTAFAWSQEFLALGPDILGRTILRALDFCAACNQQEAYETILSGAIAYHLPLPRVRTDLPYNVKRRMADIRGDWADRIKLLQENASYTENHWQAPKDRLATPDQINQFIALMTEHFGAPSKELPYYPGFHPNEGKYEDREGIVTTGGLTIEERERRLGREPMKIGLKITSPDDTKEPTLQNVMSNAIVSDIVDNLDGSSPLDRPDQVGQESSATNNDAPPSQKFQKPTPRHEKTPKQIVVHGSPAIKEMYALRTQLATAIGTIQELRKDNQRLADLLSSKDAEQEAALSVRQKSKPMKATQ